MDEWMNELKLTLVRGVRELQKGEEKWKNDGMEGR
jgi:hypothetical protein